MSLIFTLIIVIATLVVLSKMNSKNDILNYVDRKSSDIYNSIKNKLRR